MLAINCKELHIAISDSALSNVTHRARISESSSLSNSQSSSKAAAQEVGFNNKDQSALLETAKSLGQNGVSVDAVFEEIKRRNEE